MKSVKNERRIPIKERLAALFEIAPPLFGGVHIESDTVGRESRVFLSGVKKVYVLEEERIILLAGGVRLTFLGEDLFASSYSRGTVSICGRVFSVNAESVGESL